MSRRVRKKKPPLLAPAENLMRRLSDTDVRLRRKIVRYAVWIGSILIFYSLAFGDFSIPRIVRLHMERGALIETNRNKVAEIIDAEMTREQLLNDPVFIEIIARTKYHMIRPGETLYRYRGQ